MFVTETLLDTISVTASTYDVFIDLLGALGQN